MQFIRIKASLKGYELTRIFKRKKLNKKDISKSYLSFGGKKS